MRRVVVVLHDDVEEEQDSNSFVLRLFEMMDGSHWLVEESYVAGMPYVEEWEEMRMAHVVSDVVDMDVVTVQIEEIVEAVVAASHRAEATYLPPPPLNLHHSSLDSLPVLCARVVVHTMLTLVHFPFRLTSVTYILIATYRLIDVARREFI